MAEENHENLSCTVLGPRLYSNPPLTGSIRIQSPSPPPPARKFHQVVNVTEYSFSCLVAAMESCLVVSKHAATTFALLPSECHSSSSVTSQLSFVYANSADGTVQEMMSLKV